jgi:hypothetical protein
MFIPEEEGCEIAFSDPQIYYVKGEIATLGKRIPVPWLFY